ncbi:hypothetical protein [Lactobacillus helveticus]|uniref:DNA helicase n=1 Tax=Lactobacillus helveticus TaxID=1587 RepID=A0A6A7K3Z4_LACHE|nr:hypothetical protein [Lactobacillus helveticus]MPW15138.1 hypothetical protein [Lactobacillus helveticus]NRO27566.1 hypothetical protein [Lactobacillus helveticus]
MKKVKFYLAKAGSGKSYFATNLNKELENKHVLFVTYTNMNMQVLIKYLRKSPLNFKSKKVENWNEFLTNNFLMPYRKNYLKILKIDNFSGISWERSAWKSMSYVDNENNLFGYKCSKLLELDRALFTQACKRLSRFYDYIVIDEFQDITGYDINFLSDLMSITKQEFLKFILFGDVYQSNVQGTNTTMLIEGIKDIADEKRFVQDKYGKDIEIDRKTLEKSRRIGIGVSKFINQYLHIEIGAYDKNKARVFPGNINQIPVTKNQIQGIFQKVDRILVYNKKSLKAPYKEFKDKCINWGYSKGETYEGPIAVVLTKGIYEKLNAKQDLRKISVCTFTKFYVALTRSRSSVYLVYLK